MTIISLKEHGTFIEYKEGVGYIYKQADTLYAVGSHGVRKL